MKSLLLLLFLAVGVYAQYFGRNKVQYETFDFMTMHAGTFRILYYPPESTAVRLAARMLQRWQTRYDVLFDVSLSQNQPVIFYANQADFQQTNVIDGSIPQSVGGVTEGLMNRIVIPLTGIFAENDHVIGHELVHAYQYAMIDEIKGGFALSTEIPLWFIEGLAEYLSLGSRSSLTAMWMRDAIVHDSLPTITQISRNMKYFPYRYGHALWAYITGIQSDSIIGPLMREALVHGVERAFKRELGIPQDTLSYQWQQAIHASFDKTIEGRTKPSDLGTTLIKGNEINIAPSISPDGKYLAFISSKQLFSIELFLADAHTGKIITQLTSSQADEHFDALRYFNASGTWSSDGSLFAFTVFQKGDNAVSIVKIPSGEILRTITIPDITAITQIAWSPDDRYLAIAGDSGSVSDIFLYDLQQQSTANLTNDLYAQLQPAWSPDGSKLAFITDMAPATDFDTLSFAPMQIAVMDIATRAVGMYGIADWVTHSNPQFGPDGADLYCIANPDGVPNIYRYSFGDEQFYQITNVATGISGITELSPALSVSPQTAKIVCTIFSNASYEIHTIDTTTGKAFVPQLSEYIDNVTLPPIQPDQSSFVSSYLDDPSYGLPLTDSISVEEYSPSLRLYYIGQLFVGAAINRGGIGVGAGVAMVFSDLLGNHLLGVAAQISGGVLDFGAEVQYLNRRSRLNWGIGASHYPSLFTRVISGDDTVTINGDTVGVNELILVDERVFEDRIQLSTEYPLSTNRRFEFSGSFSRISYYYTGERIVHLNNEIITQSDIDVTDPSGLNLLDISSAFVADFAFYGFTSPVSGRRYRFELTPTFGSLLFISALADYRQYFFINPLTFAYRVFHFGRYLNDAEDDRLSQYFLGNQTLVRGYGYYSFDLSECSEEDDFKECPQFQRLWGTRLLVGNIEIRLPLLGTDQFGLINFPYLPTELAAFVDGGVAWTQDDPPEFTLESSSRQRIPVISTGAAARFGIANFFVLQLYLAYPFQRTNTNLEFGLIVAPGW